jgi:hypothetical protein
LPANGHVAPPSLPQSVEIRQIRPDIGSLGCEYAEIIEFALLVRRLDQFKGGLCVWKNVTGVSLGLLASFVIPVEHDRETMLKVQFKAF